MRQPTVSDIIGIINVFAPSRLSEDWDNCGLQVGDPAQRISRIMVALDPSAAVVREAVERGAGLLVTHHPLIFSRLGSINLSSHTGRIIGDSIANSLAICSAHTNYDSACGGLNDELAGMIGLSDTTPLSMTSPDGLAKLVVFVPTSAIEAVRSALLPLGEPIGNYSECSFSAEGQGSFLPGDGAVPFTGTIGTREFVEECRLELLVSRNRLQKALDLLKKVHPYEEPAFDVYPVVRVPSKTGIGRVGRLENHMPLSAFAMRVKELLGCDSVRIAGSPDTAVRRVAVCGGSGCSLIRDAVRAGADVLVTGDVKYHDARLAEESGMAILDAGHFHTERIMVRAIASKFISMLEAGGFDGCDVVESCSESDPFRYI